MRKKEEYGQYVAMKIQTSFRKSDFVDGLAIALSKYQGNYVSQKYIVEFLNQVREKKDLFAKKVRI